MIPAKRSFICASCRKKVELGGAEYELFFESEIRAPFLNMAFCSEECVDAAAGLYVPDDFRRRPGAERVESMREALERLVQDHPDVKKLHEALDDAIRIGHIEQAMKISHVLKEFIRYLVDAHGRGITDRPGGLIVPDWAPPPKGKRV